MTRSRHLRPLLLLAVVLTLALFAGAAVAQEEEERELGWFNDTELSWVQVGGNAESSTFSLRNKTRRVWNTSEWTIGFGGLRADTATITRFAIGTEEDFQVGQTETTEVTAENYYLRSHYDQEVNDFWFWYVGAGWERNQFAGFDSRTAVAAGAGSVWHDGEVWHFRTNYGLTYTVQDDIVETPERKDGFIGLQLGYDYRHQLTGNTLFTNVLLFDGSLEETDDWRTDFRAAIAVSMTDLVALSFGIDLLYYNQPALAEVDLFGPGGEQIGTVLAPLDNLDTKVAAALVLSF